MTDSDRLEKKNDGSIFVPKRVDENISGKASKNGPNRKRIGREFLYIHL